MAHIEFNMDDMQRELLIVRKNRRFVMRYAEERAHDLVETSYTTDQLMSVVRKCGLCDICDFTGLNISAARVIVNCAITAIYKYPFLRGVMCYIGSKKGYMSLLKKFSDCDTTTLKLLGVQHICDSDTSHAIGQALSKLLIGDVQDPQEHKFNILAQAISGFGILDGILLDEEDFSTERFLQIKMTLKQNVESRFFPEGCDSVTSIIYHEIGHLLDYRCKISEDREVIEQFEGQSKQEIGNRLSIYAASSIQEYVAEGFAEYMSNSAPREAACLIAEAIEKCYHTLIASR